MRWVVGLINLILFFSFSGLRAHQLPVEQYEIIVKGGKKGLRNAAGKTIIPPKYEDIGWSDGVGPVPLGSTIGYKQNEQWGLITLANKKITPPQYAVLYKSNSGHIIGAKSGALSRSLFYGLFNEKGQVVLSFKYLSMQELPASFIVSERVAGELKYGVVNTRGEAIISIDKSDIQIVNSDLLLVKQNPGRLAALYSLEQSKTLMEGVSEIIPWERSYLKICGEVHCGLIDAQGNTVLPMEYSDFRSAPSGIEGVKNNEWKILTAENVQINTLKGNDLAFLGNFILIKANNYHRLLNQGLKVVAPDFDTILSSTGALVLFQEGHKYGVFNVQKQKTILNGFDSLRMQDEFIYAGRLKNNQLQWAVYDTFAVKRSQFEYEQVRDFSSRLFAVKRRGHWGFMDRNGKEVVHCVYDSVGEFMNGKVVVSFHGESGVINTESHWEVVPRKGTIEWIGEDTFLTRYQGKTILENLEGELIYFTDNRLAYNDNLLYEYRDDSTVVKVDLKGRIVEQNIAANNKVETTKFEADDWMAVKIKGKYGFVDAKTGQLRITNRYEDVGHARGELISVKILGKWGAINKNENLIIQPNYDGLLLFDGKIAIARFNNKFGAISNTGDMLLSFEYSAIEKQPSGRYLLNKDGQYGLMRSDGRVLVNAKYDSLVDLNNGYVLIQKSGKYGVITIDGVNTIPHIFDEIIYNPESDSYFALSKQKWELLIHE